MLTTFYFWEEIRLSIVQTMCHQYIQRLQRRRLLIWQLFCSKFDFTPDDLNCPFVSIADKFAEALTLASTSPVPFCSLASSVFYLSEVSESLVISIINGLETKKTTGSWWYPGQISKGWVFFFWKLQYMTCKLQYQIWNFADLWKSAVVTLIQKTKKSNELTNFCPISVLPVLS